MYRTSDRRPKPYDALCLLCSKPINAPPAMKRKYCCTEHYHRANQGCQRDARAVFVTKICLHCGEPFVVGGKQRPNKRGRFCTHDCSTAYTYESANKALELSATDAAYLAGIVDGEGCLCLYRGRHGKSVAGRLSIANTDKGLVDWCRGVTGIGNPDLQPSDRGPQAKKQWIWSCSSLSAESVLLQLLPYLKVKRPQADLFLSFIQRKRDESDTRLAGDWQEEYRLQMRALNQRGPASLTA